MTREEAIEVVYGIDVTKAQHEALQFLIPELCESEDERIRKHLVEVVELYWGKTNDPDKVKDLVYLEKQKEQKLLSPEDKVKHPLYVEGFDAGIEVGRQFEKVFDEQKPDCVCKDTVEIIPDDKVEEAGAQFMRMRETKPTNIGEFLDRLTTVEQEFLWEHIEAVKKLDKKEKQKELTKEKVEPITDGLSTEFQKQVSYLIASSINKEHEYSEGYVKWVSQSLLGYAKFAMSQHEKQKEQKPADDKAFEEWIDDWWKHNKVNNPDSYDNGDEIQFDERGFKNFCRGIRNMYQQKPAELSDDNIKELTEFEAAMLHIGMSFFGGSAGLNPNNTNEVKKQAKLLLELVPKQEWSEYDEKIIQSIIKDIEFERNYTFATTGKIIGKYNEQIDWLKYLSFNLKKKNEDVAKLCSNEWSEEDEEKLKAICTYLQDYSRLAKRSDKLRFNEYCDFLKSLRPQSKQDVLPSLSEKEIICFKRALDYLRKEHNRYGGEDFTNEIAVLEWFITHPILVSDTHWKPSKEQMGALNYAYCELFKRKDVGDNILGSLQKLIDQLREQM